jgi:hypothetical protein
VTSIALEPSWIPNSSNSSFSQVTNRSGALNGPIIWDLRTKHIYFVIWADPSVLMTAFAERREYVLLCLYTCIRIIMLVSVSTHSEQPKQPHWSYTRTPGSEVRRDWSLLVMRHGRSFVSSRAGPGGRLAASLPRRVSPASSLRSISAGFFFILTF